MDWLTAVSRLRARREPGVLVTVASVRGHAPRDAGAKMVVGLGATWGSVGGGNLEAVAIERGRSLLDDGSVEPALVTVQLSDKAPYEHGVQCCGGEVTLLIEPLPVAPAVAIFGIGHVGLELARILARHDLELHLVDSRPAQLAPERLAVLDDAVARVQVHEVPVLPELVLAELPPGTHVLVMTHDHAEDAALCDAALRRADLGSIGLIGSAGKWARFRRKLIDEGHPAEAVDRITTPIGLPSVTGSGAGSGAGKGAGSGAGKDPASIAVSVAAALLPTLHAESSRPRPENAPSRRNLAP